MTLQITTIAFLILMMVLFHFTQGSYRRWILFFGSMFFIYVEGGVLGLAAIFVATLFTWKAGRALFTQKESGKTGKAVMALSIAVLVLVLIGWKYIPHMMRSRGIDVSTGILSLPVPIGLSFYIFQSISYIADIYMGKITPSVGLLNFALYMVWFPKWMSGPIERADSFISQLQYQGNIRNFSFHRITHAASYIVWGLVLKLLIADKLAVVVDTVFSDISLYGAGTLILASLMYTIQIYCDFAGYTDIAIGVSKLFGIDLTKNFRTPYMAENIVDFWRRWHISLSNFLRDYIYIPLGGNRKGIVRKHINTIIVFLVCGMWHGVGLSFIVWGMIHAVLNVLTSILQKTRLNYLVKGNVGRVITFLCVSFAWIFFRADSLSQGMEFVKGMIPFVNANSFFAGMHIEGAAILGLRTMDWWIAWITIAFMTFQDAYSYKRDTVPAVAMITGLSDNRRLVLLTAIMSLVLIFGQYGSGAEIREFVYMNF
ncbi:MBOAT family protein [Butyrivibrio sp. CB08]|uniref:MBOAT family O-acyltransferase n=1 Tax=Butyrivibrio sp. CB08 TaxID=2364879 RepID=UPI000EAA8958|nr:MBOAT family O-acyltransferase [Butyrivibrio sp. CB08]RKM57817.1 MBOAT family protein [Butyrivibrio sp. CB08]